LILVISFFCGCIQNAQQTEKAAELKTEINLENNGLKVKISPAKNKQLKAY